MKSRKWVRGPEQHRRDKLQGWRMGGSSPRPHLCLMVMERSMGGHQRAERGSGDSCYAEEATASLRIFRVFQLLFLTLKQKCSLSQKVGTEGKGIPECQRRKGP
jgi:hypothetical protein